MNLQDPFWSNLAANFVGNCCSDVIVGIVLVWVISRFVSFARQANAKVEVERHPTAPMNYFFDIWNISPIMFRKEEIHWTIYFKGYPPSYFTNNSPFETNTTYVLEEMVSGGEEFVTMRGFTRVPAFSGERVRLFSWNNHASADVSRIEMFYVLSTPYGLMPRRHRIKGRFLPSAVKRDHSGYVVARTAGRLSFPRQN